MARRRYFTKKVRRKKSMTVPLAVVGGFVPTALGVWNRRSSATAIGQYLQAGWTGVDSTGHFNLANLRAGAIPAIAGMIVHMLASKMGINRMIAAARIPLIRI